MKKVRFQKFCFAIALMLSLVCLLVVTGEAALKGGDVIAYAANSIKAAVAQAPDAGKPEKTPRPRFPRIDPDADKGFSKTASLFGIVYFIVLATVVGIIVRFSMQKNKRDAVILKAKRDAENKKP